MNIERKLATIRRISSITPIEGADMIETAHIDGWKVVVAKEHNFKINDLVLYCEIDSVLPERPEFVFLRPKKFRIKTVRLRGQISQGIVFPLSILEGYGYTLMKKDGFDLQLFDKNEHFITFLTEGTDLTNELEIIKYEPRLPTELDGVVRSTFPSHLVPKSDQMRCQNLVADINQYKEKGIEFVVTEKLDGTSCTFIFNNNDFMVCSRNMSLFESENNTYWKIAREFEIEEKLKYLKRNIAIQGEIVGPSIQGNHYRLAKPNFFMFDAFDIDNQKYLDWKEMELLSVYYLGVELVPVLEDSLVLNELSNIERMLGYAEARSVLYGQVEREGVVFRAVTNDPLSYLGKISFKAISNKYLLGEK